jgi:predicted dehydrogenase
MTRRRFLSTAAGGVSTFVIVPSFTRGASPNEKLNIAVIGSGGRGAENLRGVSSENIVALCDVDQANARSSFEQYPNAKRYDDWRKLLDSEKTIDAVVVSTPDHNHAIISIAAMRLGKHVYCEKPLARSIYEARRMREVAEKSKVATQMGTQGHAFDGTRNAVEVLRAGIIGDVSEIHVWTDRPANWWPQGVGRPPETPPVPKTLSWDLWLGPAPHRPYNPAYVPFKWRGFWDFGTGAIGDMGIHNLDTAYWGLEPGVPTQVSIVDCSPALTEPSAKETAPLWSILRLQFPARGSKPAVTMTWYDGGKLPPEDLFQGEPRIGTDGGSLVIGSKGTLFTRTWHGGENESDMFVLLPRKTFADAPLPAPTLPRTPSHHREWLDAIRGQATTQSPFSYAAVLTESLLLGNVALRAGGPIEWDHASMRASNNPAAEPFIRPRFRTGWTS